MFLQRVLLLLCYQAGKLIGLFLCKHCLWTNSSNLTSVFQSFAGQIGICPVYVYVVQGLEIWNRVHGQNLRFLPLYFTGFPPHFLAVSFPKLLPSDTSGQKDQIFLLEFYLPLTIFPRTKSL